MRVFLGSWLIIAVVEKWLRYCGIEKIERPFIDGLAVGGGGLG